MKINGNEIRPGNVLEYNNRLWVAVKTQHVKPGKGGAFMQVEMKDIRDGTKLNERFRSSDTVEKVRLETDDYQFLYRDGDLITLMNPGTYDQVSVRAELAGDAAQFLQDGMTVVVESYDNDVIHVALPDHMTFTVAEADPVVKGQTASSSFKPAVLDNGVKIMVPPFITAGERVVVHTADGSYVERAKAA